MTGTIQFRRLYDESNAVLVHRDYLGHLDREEKCYIEMPIDEQTFFKPEITKNGRSSE